MFDKTKLPRADRPNHARVTMNDIARRAGVSLGTVSNVINGKGTVRQGVKERVQSAISALDYQPNQLSRALRTNRSNLIGVIIPDITNPFFPWVVRGIEDVAFEHSYRLLLCNADNDVVKETSYLSDLSSFLPAGIILIPSLDHQVNLKSRIPLVCIDRRPPDWRGDAVTAENFQGGYAAGSHIVKHGHTVVGIVRGPANIVTASERVQGFLEALGESGVTVSPEYIQEGPFDQDTGYSCAARLLRMVPQPTAIFTTSDLMAVGALSAIKAANLRCPQDVSLVGFDGLNFTEFTEPALTSVAQPSYQLGYTAARLLIERIADPSLPPRHIVLKTELKIRDSVQKPFIHP